METRLIIDTRARTSTNGAAYTRGSVAETWGAAIREASVHAGNVQTGITQTVISDRQSRYRAPEWRVGDYEVRVSHAGFDTVVVRAEALAVGVQNAVEFSLAMGRQPQTVVVQAQVSQVETTNDAIGSSASRQQMPGTKEKAMVKELFITLSPLALLAGAALAQDAKAVLDMGDVTSIQYSCTRHLAGAGPDECCPRWNADITGFNNGAYEQGRLV